MADFYAIARLTGCFGVKGYLKLQVLTHSPRRLLKLKKVSLGVIADNLQEMDIEDVLFQHRNTLVKFAGIDSRTAAEQYVGQYLFIAESNVIRPPNGSYFIHELLNCEVRTEDGRLIGVIEDVLKMPSQDVWTVCSGNQVKMIPAVKDFILHVDLKNRTVTVKTIEGLL